MKRREFFARSGLAAAGVMAQGVFAAQTGMRISWIREVDRGVYSSVTCPGHGVVHEQAPGLLDGFCRLAAESSERAIRLNARAPAARGGPLHAELTHELRDSGAGGGDDVLEACLTVRNTSARVQQVVLGLASSVRPAGEAGNQGVYLPLSAAGLSGDGRFAALGVKGFLKACDQALGSAEWTAHYLEPAASHPADRQTRALLLAPVVDRYGAKSGLRVALMTPSDEPMRFGFGAEVGPVASRCVTIPPGGTCRQRGWLLLHTGDASAAWRVFHRLAHEEALPVPDWARQFKVHYYDFLSSAAGRDGRRGGGYEADLAHFREFSVGMGTQHGYYPAIGDYVHPGRKAWQAMCGDKRGPAEMSLEKMRARIRATQAAGAKAAVYLHAACLDDAADCFNELRDCIQVDAEGRPMKYGWSGPDTVGTTWRASLAAEAWREHLLEQAGWIMDLLKPDAIVVDETFAGLGYDHHADRGIAISAGAIDFYRELRSLVRSFGEGKAFFTSDCSMSPFVLWADGECGDHAYGSLLGHPLYTEEPVRYLAALGGKPWRPCAWHFQQMWPAQMKLARQVGAGVGVSNGWLEYTGLARLPAEVKSRMLGDIATLFEERQ